MPTTPTFLPGPTCQWRSGEYVVIPAHSSGADGGQLRFGMGYPQHVAFIDHYLL